MKVGEALKGGLSLLKGMKVTLRTFLSPSVTCQYPRETLLISPRYRGHIKLVGECRACGVCERACPTGCITVHGEKVEGQKGRVLKAFLLDFTRCSHCGLCVEACPQKAIAFSLEYNLASTKKEDFYYDLLAEYRSRGG